MSGPEHSNPLTSPAFTRRRILGGMLATGAAGVMSTALPIPSSRPTKAFAADGAAVKPRSTYYTSARVAAARRNVGSFSWAGTLRDEAVAAADRAMQISDEQAWHMVPAQSIPRAISPTVDRTIGSPITGPEIYDFGLYPWLADPYTRPWKLVDPSSDYVFPTNDFAAFYASGLNDRGEFDRALADESLLVNELYPERGPTWGVDDGYGWIDDEGTKWAFVAYYAHWYLWYTKATQDTAAIHYGVSALRDAFATPAISTTPDGG